MAKYKIWLTVKDGQGNTKELDSGIIDVGVSDLSPEAISQIEQALPLNDFLKKSEIDVELDHYATDKEVEQAAKEAAKTAEVVKYAGFQLRDEEGGAE